MSCEKCGCVAIKEQDIYDLTPLIADTRIFERRSCIMDAHEINLKSAMGSECYKALCTAIKEANNDLDALPDSWKNLVEELGFKQMLAWWIYYHWLSSYGSSQSTLNGETQFDTSNQDGGRSVDSKSFTIKLAAAKGKAEYYSNDWKLNSDLGFCKTVVKCEPCSTSKGMDLYDLQKV